MKKAIVLIIVVVVILSQTACGGSNDLVGAWEKADNNAGFSGFTLHSDGTGNVGSRQITWSVKGDRMTWTDLGNADSEYNAEFTYKLSGNALTLTHIEWGTVSNYKKS